MQILELPDATEEQYNMVIRVLEAMNITVLTSKPQNIENQETKELANNNKNHQDLNLAIK